jgi:hypothetical protein
MGQGQGQQQEEISVADQVPGSGAFVTPGSGMGKKSRSRSYFRKLRKNFLGQTYLILLRMRIRDPESFGPWIWDPGWKNSDPG